MLVGVQFQGTIAGGETQYWRTVDWPEAWYVVWSLMPTTPTGGAEPQLTWETEVERTPGHRLNYWITVRNLSPAAVDFEARYAVLHQ
jgi:hypothetical protein